MMCATVLIATEAGGILPEGTAHLLLVVLVVGVGVALTISIRMKIARRNAAIPSAREQIEALKTGNTIRMDAEAVHASLHDVARKLSAQLDNKAERLAQLITQAEARIAQLEALDERGAEPQRQDEAKGRSVSARSSFEYAEADQAPAARTHQPAGAKPHLAPASARTDAEPADSLRRAVYALADSGRSPVEISHELDEHIGKVELILALRHG